jgi:hypothetical protein
MAGRMAALQLNSADVKKPTARHYVSFDYVWTQYYTAYSG